MAATGMLLLGVLSFFVGTDARADSDRHALRLYVPISSQGRGLGDCFVVTGQKLRLDQSCRMKTTSTSSSPVSAKLHMFTRYGVFSGTEAPRYDKDLTVVDTLNEKSADETMWEYEKDERWGVCSKYGSQSDRLIATTLYTGKATRTTVTGVEYKEGTVKVDWAKKRAPETLNGRIGLLLTPIQEVCATAAEHRITSLEASLKDVSDRATELTRQLEDAERRLNEAKSTAKKLEEDLDTARKGKMKADGELDIARKDLTAANGDVQKEQAKNKALEAKLKTCSCPEPGSGQ